MIKSRISSALIVLAGSAALGACTTLGPYGGVGVGVGSGYGQNGPYGYGSPYGYGYGSPYGQGIYGYGGYPYSSYYAGYPYYGWYDGFYYPGAGYYVYDPYGGRYPITERQSRYWQNIRERFRKARGVQSAEVKENWSGFASRAKVASPPRSTVGATAGAIADPRALRQISESRQQARAERLERARAERLERVERIERRQQVRSERQDGIRQQILERREQRRGARPTE